VGNKSTYTEKQTKRMKVRRKKFPL
jgi:hypothetical protein